MEKSVQKSDQEIACWL